jgi:hypothetical protein
MAKDRRSELLERQEELREELRKVDAELLGFMTPEERVVRGVAELEESVKQARKRVEDGREMPESWRRQYLMDLVLSAERLERELERAKGGNVAEPSEEEQRLRESRLRREYGQ